MAKQSAKGKSTAPVKKGGQVTDKQTPVPTAKQESEKQESKDTSGPLMGTILKEIPSSPWPIPSEQPKSEVPNAGSGEPIFDEQKLKERIGELINTESNTESSELKQSPANVSDDNSEQMPSQSSEAAPEQNRGSIGPAIEERVPTLEEIAVFEKKALEFLDKHRTTYSENSDGKHVNALNLAMNHLQFSLNSLNRFIEDTK